MTDVLGLKTTVLLTAFGNPKICFLGSVPCGECGRSAGVALVDAHLFPWSVGGNHDEPSIAPRVEVERVRPDAYRVDVVGVVPEIDRNEPVVVVGVGDGGGGGGGGGNGGGGGDDGGKRTCKEQEKWSSKQRIIQQVTKKTVFNLTHRRNSFLVATTQ